MKIISKTILLALAVALYLTSASLAQELITNGGFESGFAGWTRNDQLGSDGTWSQQTGTTSPVSGNPVPAPPGATHAAMTDAQGPGSHVLYQDFTVPLSPGAAMLSFDLYIGNRAAAFFSPASLDFSTATLNQQFRADIIKTSADPFSVAAADVLLNVYQTQPANPLVSGYVTIVANLTSLLAAHAGETLRLRFAEADNVFTFNAGVDNVSLKANAAVPETGESFSLLLIGVGIVGLLFVRQRRMPVHLLSPRQF